VAAANGWPRVPFVAESVALPAAVPVVVPAAIPATSTIARIQGIASPDLVAIPLELRPLAPLIAAAPVPEVKAAAKPKKKIVREPQPDRVAHPSRVHPDSRSAYAAEPRPPGFLRSILGLGL
jgi:hypothetical protein